MYYKITLALFSVLILSISGCRTGEFPFDKGIYDSMQGLLQADELTNKNIFKNEDGSMKIECEKGEIRVWLAFGLDPDSRMQTVGRAFEIFHEQYMKTETNKKPDGTFRREIITCRGLVEDTELYVLSWIMSEPDPKVDSNRDGNFM